MQYFLSLQGVTPNEELCFKVNRLLSDAWKISSVTLNINDALVWADGFKFPADVGKRDLQDLKRCGSIQQLCLERFSVVREKKLNVSRVLDIVSPSRMKSFDATLDKARALEIAESGMSIPTSSSFVTCNIPPPLRTKYLRVHPAVNKIIYAMYEKGDTVIIIPTDEAKQIPGVHFSATHWTTKKNKAS